MTTTLATIGAITGVASLAWNIYLKLSAGPKVLVKVWAGMKMLPTPRHNPTYIRVNVRNTGTVPTKLTTLGLLLYSSEKAAKKHKKPEQSFVCMQLVDRPSHNATT